MRHIVLLAVSLMAAGCAGGDRNNATLTPEDSNHNRLSHNGIYFTGPTGKVRHIQPGKETIATVDGCTVTVDLQWQVAVMQCPTETWHGKMRIISRCPDSPLKIIWMGHEDAGRIIANTIREISSTSCG